VDCTTNRKRCTATIALRWIRSKKRSGAVMALRRAGCKKGCATVFKAGMMAAAQYAVETHGASDSMLLQMRRTAAHICGVGGQGRSLLLTMLLHQDQGMDPAVSVTVNAAVAWASLAWDQKMEKSDLRVAI
jgi:hypothetical protein